MSVGVPRGEFASHYVKLGDYFVLLCQTPFVLNQRPWM